jgi:2-oxoglutarate ferredoxin oxidoreductase subunit alpha
MMCPFPADEVKGILKSAKRVMIVECNYSGQLRKIIAQETGVVIPQLIAKYTGRPVLCDELLESLERLYRNGNVRKEVLTVGA